MGFDIFFGDCLEEYAHLKVYGFGYFWGFFGTVSRNIFIPDFGELGHERQILSCT